MAYGQTVFSTLPSVVPPSSAIRVRKGDDVTVPFAITDGDGVAVELTGATVGATVYDRFVGVPFTASALITNAAAGLGNAVLSGEITSGLTAQSPCAPVVYGALSVWLIDTAGKRHTFDPLGLLTLRPQDFTEVAVQPDLQTLIIDGTQGPAGPAGPTMAQILAAFVALPTTLPSQAGQLWNNGGFIAVS